MTQSRFSPRPLNEDDEGYASENAQSGARRQDDAFCAALRAAGARGHEHVREGVKVADEADIRVLPRPFVPANVATSSWPFD